MAQASDPVWINVLPSMKGFGPAVSKGTVAPSAAAGKASGMAFGKAMLLGVAAVATAGLAAGVALYKVGEVFNDVTETIRVGSGASGEALDGLVDVAKSIGTKIPASFEAIGSTVADVSTRMGLTGDMLDKVASQYLEAGRILGEEVDVGKTSAAFNAFKIEGEDVSGALDHLFQVSQATGIGMNELASAASVSAPAMQTLGFSFEETTAMVGSFDKAGLNSQQMMAAMSKGLVTLAKDGEEPQEAFKRVQTEIAGFIEKGDEAGALNLASKVFGTRGATQFVGAVKSGALNLDDMSKAAGQTGDTILGLGDETMNFSEQWQLFKNNVLVWLEPMGARVFGALGTLMGEVVEGVTAFGDAWKANDGEITSSGIPGMFERLGSIARQTFDYFKGTVIPNLKSFGQWLGDNAKTIGVVAGVITVLLLPAFVRLGVGALASAKKTVTAWVMHKVEAIKAGATYVAQSALIVGRWVAMSTAAVLSGAKTAAVWTGSIIGQAVKGAVAFAVQVGRVVAGWVLMGVQSLIQAARMAAAWLIAMGPVGWVIAAVIGLVAIVIANWDKISAFTKKAWEAIVGWVTRAWENIKTGVSNAINWVKKWIESKLLDIQTKWNRIWTAVKDTVSRIWDGIKTVVSKAIDWVKSILSTGLSNIKNNWSNAWNWVKTKVSDVWDGIKTVVSNAWDKLKTTLITLIDFVKSALPEAFEKAKDGIGTAWGKIKDLAKKPVRFVVDTVIGGLVDTFNKIPGVNISKPKLPRGFRKGGYTGDGREDEEAGVVHGREFVFPARATAAIGKENLAAMVSGAGNMGGFFHGNAASIRRAGAYHLNVPGSMNGWNFPGAARMWDGAAGVRVKTGRGQHQGYASQLERGGQVVGYTRGTNIDMSPSWMSRLSSTGRRTVAAHEIGHALGLPHNGRRSIMQPNLGQMSTVPTPLDIRNLQSLYPGGSGKAGSGVVNPFSGLVDALMEKIKSNFPGAGMFVDAAGGLAKTGIGQVVKLVESVKDGIKNIAGNVFNKIKGFFGGGAASSGTGGNAPALYDTGGILPSGMSTVLNKTGKPEAILNSRQWGDIHTLAKQGSVRAPVYVQNPFTGDYLLARVADTAVNATGSAIQSAQDRLYWGGKNVGGLV